MFITDEIKKEAEYAKTKLGYLPDILNSHTFNEHILNNKFFKQHPLLIQTTDKVAVNDYVTGKGFADLLISNYLKNEMYRYRRSRIHWQSYCRTLNKIRSYCNWYR